MSDGLCECGCGLPTTVSPRNVTGNGYVKGVPRRFRLGHCGRDPRGDQERFLAAIDRTGPCWLWTGCRRRFGYGMFCVASEGRKKNISAHRMSWMIFRGPIPVGKWVLHHCDNPPCVNPEHLYVGTVEDNIRDRQTRRRMANGERIARSVLTADQVAQIRVLLREERMKQGAIGRLFGVTANAVNHIHRGRTWRHA